MTTPSLVAKNFLVLFGSQVLAKLFLLFSSILLANYLGVEVFGTYSFAVAFAALFTPLADLGSDAFLTRELAQGVRAEARSIGSMLVLKAGLALLTFLAAATVLQVLGYSEDTRAIVYLAVVIVISKVFINSSFVVFRAFQRLKYESAITVLERVLEFLAVLFAIWVAVSIIQFMVLVLLTLVVSGIASFGLMKKKIFTAPLRWKRDDVGALVRGGVPFALSTMFVTVYFQIDSVMLSKMVGDESVGLYRSAYNLIFGLFIFSAAIVTNLYPFIARYYQPDKSMAIRVAQRAVRYSLMVGIPVALGGTLFSSDVMALLYSREYLVASRTLSIIIWVLPIMYVTNILGHVLGAIHLQRTVLVITIVNAAFNIVLNLILIPLYSQNGAAVATVATEFLGLILLSSSVRHRFGPYLEFGAAGRILLASFVLVPLALLPNTVPFLVILPVAVILYAAAAILLGIITIEEVKEFVLSVDREESVR